MRPKVGEDTVTVDLIDWSDPSANDFAIAEEVTVGGRNAKRPDLVLYVNGIALGVLELKRSTVSVSEGIRQNLANQEKHFIPHFFTTVQLVMAGNDSQGLRYGVVGTPEKYWLRWKDKEVRSGAASRTGAPAASESATRSGRFGSPLLEELADPLCSGPSPRADPRLRGLRRGRQEDLPPQPVLRREGSPAPCEAARRRDHLAHAGEREEPHDGVAREMDPGERYPDGRVLVITDRTELDDQIEQVFHGRERGHPPNEERRRPRRRAPRSRPSRSSVRSSTSSAARKRASIDRYVRDLRAHIARGSLPVGDLYVFVDECHRTQSGKLHRAMKKLLPEATLIGFTGTPLLRSDKPRRASRPSVLTSTLTSTRRRFATRWCWTCVTRRGTSTST